MRLIHHSRFRSSNYLSISVAILFVVAPIAHSSPPAQKVPERKKDPDPGDFDRLAEVFAPAKTPNIKGKKWVTIDTGPSNCPSTLDGWLIEDNPKQLKILDFRGDVHRLRRPTADENRPRIKEEKGGGILLGNIQKADHSVAWKIQSEDFPAKARKFLADGPPQEKAESGVFGFYREKYSLAARMRSMPLDLHFMLTTREKKHLPRNATIALAMPRKSISFAMVIGKTPVNSTSLRPWTSLRASVMVRSSLPTAAFHARNFKPVGKRLPRFPTSLIAMKPGRWSSIIGAFWRKIEHGSSRNPMRWQR